MIYTQDEVDKLHETMSERRKIYKSRQFENGNQQAIEDHLTSLLVVMGDQHVGAYNKLMWEKGEWFIGRKLAKDYPVCADYKKRRRPKKKECFYNSQMFTVLEDAGKYYEGFMCDGIIAVQHGWVVMDDGNVVDFTLEDRDRFFKKEKMPLRESPFPIAYLGLHVPTEFVKKKIVELKITTPMAHMYYLNDNRQFLF